MVYFSTCSNHILSFKSALKGGGYTSGGGGGGSGRLVWLWCFTFGAFLLLAHGARGLDAVTVGYDGVDS